MFCMLVVSKIYKIVHVLQVFALPYTRQIDGLAVTVLVFLFELICLSVDD